jgi:uncharacterized protein
MKNVHSFSVKGTTCSSCEVLIEREIQNIEGVVQVNVSHTQRCVNISMVKNCGIQHQKLNEVLSEHGYHFSPIQEQVKQKWNVKRTIQLIVVTVFVYWLMKATGFLTYSPSIDAVGGLLGVLLIGLIASVSSCAAVLSGLVVAISTSIAKGTEPGSKKSMKPHYLFNIGRLAGFIFFGGVIGFAGSIVQLSISFNGFMILLVALLMLGLGINLLEIIPKGVSFIRPPKKLAHFIHNISTSENPKVPFVLGAMTFFLPCGFTQAMQLYALSLGDVKSSAILMGVFALGTLPALLGIGKVATSAKGKSLKRLTTFAGIVVVALGVSNIQNGFALLDFRPFAMFERSYTMDASTISMINGEQLIQMEVSSRGVYIPQVLTVQKDIPVRWEIYGAKFMGCADSLILREFGVRTYLRPGSNTVNFTPNKTGSFTFSCSMGMIRGTMKVIPKTL